MVQSGDNHGKTEEDTGGLIPGTRKPAYSLAIPQDMPIPVLIAVPHAGRDYPDALIKKMRRPDYSKVRLEDRHVDHIAARVAEQTGAGLLVARAPRAMLDLNRATDDVDWDMVAQAAPGTVRHSLANRRARSGLGLVPRRLPGLGEIWNERLSQTELAARIRRVHEPYHSALSGALQAMRDQWGAALLLDFHSMPPLKKAHEDDVPAHFVVGDRFGASADDRIVAGALRHLSHANARVAHNRPYAGGYVLDRHAAPARALHAVQLEICRSLYLAQDMTSLSDDTSDLVQILSGLVRHLAEKVAALGRGQALPVAAE
ncbi:N-formylglutamate amidohydrolase [Pontixanthobacter aquaemixtae]|uniref:N-formylglutamate amidohydrolase n=1 Tax=Pontixanthobacter aquaemixtae TaxID=1958940 RepID=A0A844ZRS5_9SPHN|nr:N-formylglutamate amidohydrolase [Pontixanthobacter aquaemixtae]MXO90555.1 N-formylglutamate amidohydrolase [Pontixanthobacter aquaemixtae]